MTYIDLFGIKKDIVDTLRDHLYPRQTLGTTFYDGMTMNTRYAQSFYPFSTKMDSISVYVNTVGTGLNALTVSVQEDVSNAPSGTMLGSITFTQANITDDAWDTKAMSYTKFISKNKYWLVLESSGQDSSNYYKIGCDSVRTNYQEGLPKESTNSTWTTVGFDLMFNVITPNWIYPHYPSDTITNNDLPRIAVDIVDRRVDERYCSKRLALGYLTGLGVIYSQYSDELDKIFSYGERGLFEMRMDLPNINLLTPRAISPIDRIREKMFIRPWTFELRKKLKYISNTIPTVE